MVRAYERQTSPYGKKNPCYLCTRSEPWLDLWCTGALICESCPLCCKWLEWCRCNHVWPFKIACGQWLVLCWVFRPRSQACHVTEIRVKPRCFLLSCHSSFSVCQSLQQLDMIRLHAHNTAGRSSCGWGFIHIIGAEACQACLMLMLDVS